MTQHNTTQHKKTKFGFGPNTKCNEFSQFFNIPDYLVGLIWQMGSRIEDHAELKFYQLMIKFI